MPNRLKQILSGIMIAGDVLLLIVFLLMFLEGSDIGLSLFMIVFLGIDTWLSADYISTLHQENTLFKEQMELEIQRRVREELQKQKRREEDSEMAADIRKDREAESELDLDDLQDLLQKDYSQKTRTRQQG